MKRFALIAAAVVLAACAKKDEAPIDTTAAPAMAPAPMDSAMTMDSAMKMDSMMRDTLKDTTAK